MTNQAFDVEVITDDQLAGATGGVATPSREIYGPGSFAGAVLLPLLRQSAVAEKPEGLQNLVVFG